MKLVQKSLTHWIAAASLALATLAPSMPARAAEAAPYLAFYNPSKGFKPAQTSLTDVFLQLAGSLECDGSPAPYIRHIQAEEQRIGQKYKAGTGQEPKSHRPAYMTDAYLAQEIQNWNLLSSKLGTDSLAKDAGMCAREAIRGTRDTGTIVVDILNQHQKAVITGLEGGPKAGFESLRGSLVSRLEWNNDKVDEEQYEIARRDAVSYAVIFRGIQAKFFARVAAALPPTKAAQIKAAISSVFLDLGRLAQTEFELAMLESAARQ